MWSGYGPIPDQTSRIFVASHPLTRLGSVPPVTLVLHVDRRAWESHVTTVASGIAHPVPVVKGNGYGFGRAWLAERAALIADHIAVGTADEADAVPTGRIPVVLTPLPRPAAHLRPDAIVTVGADEHIASASGRRALVKVRSSMNRYGVDANVVHRLVDRVRASGSEVVGLSIHPPLHGTNDDHVDEIARLVSQVDASISDLDVWVSHIDSAGYDRLRATFSDRRWHLRLGTSLWHGDKTMFQLSADVIDVREVRRGDVVGYRGVAIDVDGFIVMVGCGSANGVSALSDGRSPFHFDRRRLPLIEAPHMHTSMVLVDDGGSVPRIGDLVDVQRPLINTTVDHVDWH